MKQLTIATVLIFWMHFAGAQTLEWSETYGGGGLDWTLSIAETSDGGYITGGFSASSGGDVGENAGGYDGWLLKTDALGDIEWTQTYGGSENDYLRMVVEHPNGGYIIGGFSKSNDGDLEQNSGDEDYWVMKLDEEGNIEWSKTYGGSDQDRLINLHIVPSGGYIVGGLSYSNNGDVADNYGERDYWVAKLDDMGEVEWSQNYGGSGADIMLTMELCPDGGYILGGWSQSDNLDVPGNNGEQDFLLIKLDEFGNVDWTQNYGGSQDDVLYSIEVGGDGYLLGGISYSSDGDVSGNYGDADYWIVKVDLEGNIVWEQNYGGIFSDLLRSTATSNDGGYLLAGVSSSSDVDVSGNYGSLDVWVVKIDAMGDIVWEQNYGGSNEERLYDMQLTTDDACIFAATSESLGNDVPANQGNRDYWLFKIVLEQPDCAGILNGPNSLDECGVCDDNLDNDNETCADCAGVPNGQNTEDNCGVCDDNPDNDNESCTDCMEILNGPNSLDDCGICDDNPDNDNETCADCAGIPNGQSVTDDCGVCDDNPDNDNESCADCAGVPNGSNTLDDCGECDADPNNDNTTCMGIENQLNEQMLSQISIAPVPTKNNLRLQYTTDINEEVRCVVYNSKGQAMRQESQQSRLGENQLNIDVSSYPSGVYFLQINTAKTQRSSIRFVKE